MTDYIFHKTVQGERLDNTAYKYYKNSYLIKPIIEANPHIKAAVFEEGEIIKIPIDEEITADNKSLLPIWKQ